MPKNSIMQIEKDEKKILEELETNANKSVNEIAKTCGFSRQKVWRIIKNLEKNNTIWGYIPVLDEVKLNKKSFILLMKKTSKPVTQELMDQIINRELSKKVKKTGIEIISSFYTNGIYDWVVCFNAADLKDAKGFVEVFNKLYQGYVSDIHLLENMFSVVGSRIANPEIERLNDFINI
ncbi:MAG: hypothetical protein BV456_06910 [Thermoplasmata archaeon M8B2D]|nr:MAG: hypothetical protein BV456_06910 [Thermoplasmata archaeon M8B2D]